MNPSPQKFPIANKLIFINNVLAVITLIGTYGIVTYFSFFHPTTIYAKKGTPIQTVDPGVNKKIYQDTVKEVVQGYGKDKVSFDDVTGEKLIEQYEKVKKQKEHILALVVPGEYMKIHLALTVQFDSILDAIQKRTTDEQLAQKELEQAHHEMDQIENENSWLMQ